MGIRSAVGTKRDPKGLLVDSRCLVLHIFSHLISHDLLVARLVCRQWNEWAITDDALWQRAMERELLPPVRDQVTISICPSSIERREYGNGGDGMTTLHDEFERWRLSIYERELKPNWLALFLNNNESTIIDDDDDHVGQPETTRAVPSAHMLFVLRASRRARFVFTERRFFSLFRFFQLEGTSCEQLLRDLDVIPRFEGHAFCYNCGMCGHRGEDCAVRPFFDDMFMSTQRSPRERKAIGGWQGGPGAWLPAAASGMAMWSYRVPHSGGNVNGLAPPQYDDSPATAAAVDGCAVAGPTAQCSNGSTPAAEAKTRSDDGGHVEHTENGVDRNGGDASAKPRNGVVAVGNGDTNVHTREPPATADKSGRTPTAAAANGTSTTTKKKKKKKKKSKNQTNSTPATTTSDVPKAAAPTQVGTAPAKAVQSDNPKERSDEKAKATEERAKPVSTPTPTPTAKEREREVALVLTSRRTDDLQQAIEIIARLLADVAPAPAPARPDHETLLSPRDDDSGEAVANGRHTDHRGPFPHSPYLHSYPPPPPSPSSSPSSSAGHYPPRYSPHHPYVAFSHPHHPPHLHQQHSQHSQHSHHRPPPPQPVVGFAAPPPPHHPHASPAPSMPPAPALAAPFHGHPVPYHPPAQASAPSTSPLSTSPSPSPMSSPTRPASSSSASAPAPSLAPRRPSQPTAAAAAAAAATSSSSTTPSIVTVSTTTPPPTPAPVPLPVPVPVPVPVVTSAVPVPSTSSGPHARSPNGAPVGPYAAHHHHGAPTAYHPTPSVRHYYPPNWSHYAPYLTHHHPHHPYAAPNVAAAAALGHPFATSLHSSSSSTASSLSSSTTLSSSSSPALLSSLLSTPVTSASSTSMSSPTFSFSSFSLSCTASTASAASRPVTFAVHAIPAALVSPSSSPPGVSPPPLLSFMARTASAPLPSLSPTSPSATLPPAPTSPPTSPHMGSMARRVSSPAIAVPAQPPHHHHHASTTSPPSSTPSPSPPPSSSSSSPSSSAHRTPRPSSPAFAPSSSTIVAHRVSFHVPVQGAK